MTVDAVRLDTWIAAVRVVKSRSLATAACRGGHVTLNGQKARASASVRVGDRVVTRTPAGDRVLVVRRLIDKRVSAVAAAECFTDETPPPPPKGRDVRVAVRERGSGRPTKRDRRQLDRMLRDVAVGGPAALAGGPAPEDDDEDVDDEDLDDEDLDDEDLDAGPE